MEIVRRTFLDTGFLTVGDVIARPSSYKCGEIESQSVNILVLPVAGVFAKHDGPNKYVVANANHAVFIAAGSSYRISYPASIGDQCLTLRFSSDALTQALAETGRNEPSSSAFVSHCLLSPQLMVARSLLWRQLMCDKWDPLEVEELSVSLLVSTLPSVCKKEGRGLRCRSRYVESVKELISLRPERRWTLGELATAGNVSPYHLAHVFRKQVGTSIYRYVLRARLANALVAVLDADTDFTVVALETGFASHSHFTARFRALFGLTPTELRHRVNSKRVVEMRKIVTAGVHPAD